MIKNIIKILIILLISAQSSFAQYNMSTPLEGNSIANDALQFAVLKQLYKDISPKAPACFDYKVKNTQIIHFPYDVKKKNGKYIKGYWKELWTVDCCGKKIQVPITFYISKKKTTFNIEL